MTNEGKPLPEETSIEVPIPGEEKQKKSGFAEILKQIGRFLKNWGWTALLLASVLVIGYYTLFPSRGYFHSDCTDTLMWALASRESGQLFDPEFKYACLLPFGTSIIMWLLIPLTGVTMTTHVVGMLLFMLLYTAALVWMLRQMGCSWWWVSVTVLAELMLCSGSDKLREIFWGHTIYYSLDMLFLFVGMGLVFRFLDMQRRLGGGEESMRVVVGMAAVFGLTGIWFILTGMDQIISMAIFALPLMAAVAAERWLDGSSKVLSLRNIQAGCLFCMMALGMAIGYFLTARIAAADGIAAKYEEAFSTYSAMKTWPDHVREFPVAWLTLLGVDMKENEMLMSMHSVWELLTVVTGVLLLVIPVAALCCYKKIEDEKLRILILTYWFMTAVLMMGYILGKLYTAKWRLSPLVAFSAVVSVLFLRWAFAQIEWRRVMTLVMLPVFAVCLYNGYSILIMPADNTADNDLYLLADRLREYDLDYGYATFWNANGLTIVADNEIQCRSVRIDDDGFCAPYYYQSRRSWFDDQEGQERYFLLPTRAEAKQIISGEPELAGKRTEQHLVEDQYVIWVFEENLF